MGDLNSNYSFVSLSCVALCLEHQREDGHALVPPLIWKIKQQISTDPTLHADFAPALGLPEFTRRATELALGRECRAVVENRVLGIQTVGCTGAVRLGAQLLRCWYNRSTGWRGPVYIPSPFYAVFQAAGLPDVRQYRCWEAGQWAASEGHVLEDLRAAPEQAVVVLCATAYCPVATDLSQKHWKHLAHVLERRKLFPFFLMLGQGLCLGDPEQDAWPLRHCVSLGLELFCAQSFSHSFGLYGERVGHLLLVLKQNTLLLALQSQAESAVRSLWSRPATLGARVVATVLSNPANLAEWREGVRSAAERCVLIRERLREKLRLLGAPGSWDHLTQQGGLYCCTGLNTCTCCRGGRLNVTAINSCNMDYVAESIHLALTSPL
uniref:aspartate transaminase n=1 Tax=Scleropages formosus TaxID=113540 RepID=A0A8C9RI75_SCLFO